MLQLQLVVPVGLDGGRGAGGGDRAEPLAGLGPPAAELWGSLGPSLTFWAFPRSWGIQTVTMSVDQYHESWSGLDGYPLIIYEKNNHLLLLVGKHEQHMLPPRSHTVDGQPGTL